MTKSYSTLTYKDIGKSRFPRIRKIWMSLRFMLALTMIGSCWISDTMGQTIFRETAMASSEITSSEIVTLKLFFKDVQIKSAQTDEIQAKLSVTAEIIDGDLEALKKAIQPTIKRDGDSLRVTLPFIFYTEYVEKGITVIKLDNGDKITCKRLKLGAELLLPEENTLYIKAKYGHLNFLTDRIGDVYLDVKNAKVTARNFILLNVKAAYSNIYADNIEKADLFFTSSQLNCQTIKSLTALIDFGEIISKSIGNALINGTSVQLDVEEIADLKGNAAFSDFTIGTLTKAIHINTESGSIIVYAMQSSVEHIEMTAAFTTIQLDAKAVKNWSLDIENKGGTTVFRNNFEPIQTETLASQVSKYSYRIGTGSAPLKIRCDSCNIGVE